MRRGFVVTVALSDARMMALELWIAVKDKLRIRATARIRWTIRRAIA